MTYDLCGWSLPKESLEFASPYFPESSYSLCIMGTIHIRFSILISVMNTIQPHCPLPFLRWFYFKVFVRAFKFYFFLRWFHISNFTPWRSCITELYHELHRQCSSWHRELRNFQVQRINRTIVALQCKHVVQFVSFNFPFVNKTDLVSGEMIYECSWQHYFQSPKGGTSTNVHEQVNR